MADQNHEGMSSQHTEPNILKVIAALAEKIRNTKRQPSTTRAVRTVAQRNLNVTDEPTFTQPVVNLTFDPTLDCANLAPCKIHTHHKAGEPTPASGRSSSYLVRNCPKLGDCCVCSKPAPVASACGPATQTEQEVRALYGLGATVEEDNAMATVVVTTDGLVNQTHKAQFKLFKNGLEGDTPATFLRYFTESNPTNKGDADLNYRVIGTSKNYYTFEVSWTPKTCTPLNSAVCIRNSKSNKLAFSPFTIVGHLRGYVPPAETVAPPCCGPESGTGTTCPCKAKQVCPCYRRRPRLYGCAASH